MPFHPHAHSKIDYGASGFSFRGGAGLCWVQRFVFSRRTSTKVRNSQNTSGQPCISIKRKLTVTWKKITQAARPAVRHSFIPPGFILVARPHSLLWSTKTKEKKSPGGLEHAGGGEPAMARSERLKHGFCLWRWFEDLKIMAGYYIDS